MLLSTNNDHDFTREIIMEDRALRAIEPEPRGEVVQAGGASIMAVIAKAASDPNTDTDKLERLLAMYERITERDAKAAYSQAFAAMQLELPVITERGKIIVKEKGTERVIQSTGFARWEDINDAIKPILAKHGFALSFRVGVAADGKLTTTGVLTHSGGHEEQTTMTLPHDSSGSKNAVQAVGSSTSYGKRYVTQALLNLTSRGEDDDGEKGGAPPGLTEDQIGELQALIEDVGADRGKFLRYLKADSLADIPAQRFAEAVALLEKKRVS